MKLIPEPLSIYNPGFVSFFYFISLCENLSGRCWNPRWLELAFFPKSDQEFITGVWNSETCDLSYARNESNNYFQFLVLTRVQHQNFLSWWRLEREWNKWLEMWLICSFSKLRNVCWTIWIAMRVACIRTTPKKPLVFCNF